MKPLKAKLYELEIPFNEAFTHSTKARVASDAIVMRIEAEDGSVGYGEGLPRPYVTGESVDFVLDHIPNVLWPKIKGHSFSEIASQADLAQFDLAMGEAQADGIIAPNAARCTCEVALIDCALRAQNQSLGSLFPPKGEEVQYSGVIPANSPEKAAKHAKKMTMLGLEHLKVKIALGNDLARIQSVADVVGPDTPIRLDANAAWELDEAIEQIASLEQFNVEAIEAPIKRTTIANLAAYRAKTSMPISVDEYLVTLEDAQEIINQQAADIFNVRVSKLGGIWKTWQIAQMALEAGLKLQFGAQVGETAILSAAARHLIASLDGILFSEGSAGMLLLQEDVSEESIAFGFQGKAPILQGPGLGITVKEDVLEKYSKRIIQLE